MIETFICMLWKEEILTEMSKSSGCEIYVEKKTFEKDF